MPSFSCNPLPPYLWKVVHSTSLQMIPHPTPWDLISRCGFTQQDLALWRVLLESGACGSTIISWPTGGIETFFLHPTCCGFWSHLSVFLSSPEGTLNGAFRMISLFLEGQSCKTSSFGGPMSQVACYCVKSVLKVWKPRCLRSLQVAKIWDVLWLPSLERICLLISEWSQMAPRKIAIALITCGLQQSCSPFCPFSPLVFCLEWFLMHLKQIIFDSLRMALLGILVDSWIQTQGPVWLWLQVALCGGDCVCSCQPTGGQPRPYPMLVPESHMARQPPRQGTRRGTVLEFST